MDRLGLTQNLLIAAYIVCGAIACGAWYILFFALGFGILRNSLCGNCDKKSCKIGWERLSFGEPQLSRSASFAFALFFWLVILLSPLLIKPKLAILMLIIATLQIFICKDCKNETCCFKKFVRRLP